MPGLGVPPGSVVKEGDQEDMSFLEFMFSGTVSAQ